MIDENTAQQSRSIGVSIVNWRTAPLVIESLRALELEAKDCVGLHVYVVDNCSGDGSDVAIDEAIRAHAWGAWVTLIRSSTNGGFAAGNNIAIRTILKDMPNVDYVVLVNPDTQVRQGAIPLLIDFMESKPEIGLAGGRSEDPDGSPQMCSFNFPSALGEFSHYLGIGLVDKLLQPILGKRDIPENSKKVDWVSGAFVAIKREVIDAIGLMDESYFLYYEETDFILRAKRAGWDCWHVPDSRIIHHVGSSSGIRSADVRPRRTPSYWFESRSRYFIVNHGIFYAACADALAIVGFTLGSLRRKLQSKGRVDPPKMLWDLVRHSVFFRPLMRQSPRRTQLITLVDS